MANYVGATLRIPLLVYDDTDADRPLVDPTSLTVKVTRPDGTSTTYVYGTDAAIVRTATGTYYLAYVPTIGSANLYVVLVTVVLDGNTGVDRSTFQVSAV